MVHYFIMIDKEYLEKLKEEDYIAWDSLVNDPMIVGSGDDGCILPIVAIIILAIICFSVFFNVL
jgi:hypothetical protein